MWEISPNAKIQKSNLPVLACFMRQSDTYEEDDIEYEQKAFHTRTSTAQFSHFVTSSGCQLTLQILKQFLTESRCFVRMFHFCFSDLLWTAVTSLEITTLVLNHWLEITLLRASRVLKQRFNQRVGCIFEVLSRNWQFCVHCGALNSCLKWELCGISVVLL